MTSAERIIEDVQAESKRRWIADRDARLQYRPPPTEADDEIPHPADEHGRCAESFRPVDLAAIMAGDVEQPTPTMLCRRGDGIESALIYPGVVNGFHGDSGIGKSWLLTLLLAERLAAGENVMLLDLEDTPASLVSRLRLIGVPDEQIARQLVYVRPSEPFGPVEVAFLLDIIAERNITVVGIDSLGEAFGTEGINEDRDNEVGPWLRGVARVLAAAGPAVVLVDHSTKANDRQQLHPSGSKRKRAAIGGASYLIEAVTPFVKGGSGRLRLICAKDRHGTYRRGEHVAWLDLDTHPDGTASLELVAPPPAVEADAADRIIGRKIATILTEEVEPMSKAALAAAVRGAGLKGGSVAIADAIALMVHRGELIVTPGKQGAHLLSLPTPKGTP